MKQSEDRGSAACHLGGQSSQLDEPALDWSPDGSSLVYTVFEASNGHFEIHDLDMQTHKTQRLVGIDSRRPRFSPDGKLLAYTCTESGPEEVYVLRLADGRKWQISNSGGSLPRWTKAGEELFFLGADQRLRTVAAHLGSEPTFGTPILPPNAQRFFVSPYFFYEVTPDGERIFADAPSPTVLNLKLRIIVNWPALLK